MMQTTLFLAVQVLRGKSGVHILKVTQGENKWNSEWRKDTEGENPKKYICLWKTLF